MPEKRLDRIERKLDLLTDGVSTLAVKFEHLDQKVTALDQKMDAGYQRLDQKIDAGYQRLDQKMDAGYQRLEQKMEAGFNRLGNWLRSIETTQAAINGELSDKVENHEDRIVTLEQTINPSGPKTP
jgi:predicted  nucleic acid-binding Zn-ribbon protein